MSSPALRFKEFDENWNVEVLGNIVQIKSGYSPSKYELHENGEIPFLKVEELNNSNKYQEYSRFYTETCADVIPKKSVIFPKRGAAILNNKVRILKVDSLLDSNLMALIPQNTLDAEYLYYLINKVELYKIADTSTIPQINNKHIEPYEIHLPSKAEQTKIASFLSAVDEKISQLTQKHELLSQYKQGMMQRLFSQQLRFKADDGSEFGEWEEIALGKIKGVSIASGKSSHEKLELAKYYYYGSTGVIGYSNEYDYQGTRILIARVGHNAGYIYMVSGQYNVSDNTLILELPSNLDYIFIRAFLEKFQLNKLVFGTGQPLITGSLLKKVVIQVPCLEEQTKIANFLSAIDQKIEVVAEQIEQAKIWKKGLLQQMFI
ncbi:restriction endonuclease subunit S [Acinetobacter indicus]|uniref:Type I restriction modification DNA specificity domain-containing protein n=1 Tax=Acinetobacter indicus CIP 110367 TaxID=1341679 RepID=V2UDZ9_9GAMM|nr:restriction endonuclease subunit S [Acinetobacter indicus]EPF69229.1 hypothetical protein F956_03009 [Acinetobacter indicus ANC 4215]ESK47091.1 hypothetical protein P253_02648 [Acinetobacter indicus CIP 110367]